MDLLLMILMMLGLMFIIHHIMNPKKSITCKLHKWQYETVTYQDGTSQELLRCSECKKRPGEFTLNSDDNIY